MVRAPSEHSHTVLRINVDPYSTTAWRRAVLLGLLAGLGAGLLFHGSSSDGVRGSAKVSDPTATQRSKERVTAQTEHVAPTDRLSVDKYSPASTSPPSSLVRAGTARETPALVAVCVGGWLELSTPRRGASIRDHVLKILPSDVFVAGTLRGNVTDQRVAEALDGIGALAPFAKASVIRMPRPAELRLELRKSGHWEDFKLQASMGGSGRFNWDDPAHDDPRLWVPIMMSPALGNPNGNTLQEFHYQSRCINMINEHERAGDSRRPAGLRYERVMFTRLEFEWLADHPPLSLLDASFLWVPTGEDNTGVNDRHWLANRQDAEGVFRRWDALVSGRFHQIFFATSRVRPAFMSSETYNKLHLQYRKVGVARFPNVAALHCCEQSYAAGSSAAKRGVRCFAKGCSRAPCPRTLLPTPTCQSSHGVLSFKYGDEGNSAILHAVALAQQGARLEVAPDHAPNRLHIVMPRSGLLLSSSDAALATHRHVLGGLDSAARSESVLYTCKTCEGGPDVPDPVSINVTSCIFRKLPYKDPILDAARKTHPCRYFDHHILAQVCSQLGPSEIRMSRFGWFCSEVEKIAWSIDEGRRRQARANPEAQ